MIGKKISEFIDSLYINPEMEIIFNGKKLLISGYVENDLYTLSVDLIDNECLNVFTITSKSREYCVNEFEQAKIFGNKNIYEVESQIEVLYG